MYICVCTHIHTYVHKFTCSCIFWFLSFTSHLFLCLLCHTGVFFNTICSICNSTITGHPSQVPLSTQSALLDLLLMYGSQTWCLLKVLNNTWSTQSCLSRKFIGIVFLHCWPTGMYLISRRKNCLNKSRNFINLWHHYSKNATLLRVSKILHVLSMLYWCFASLESIVTKGHPLDYSDIPSAGVFLILTIEL